MKLFISRAILIAVFVCGAAVADTETVNVQWFADGSDTEGGKSHLTRVTNDGNDMILLTAEIVGLTPGDAVTLWWIVFNTPELCVDGCGGDDFARIEEAGIAVGNATGNVVKSNGTLEFGGVLRQNTPDDHQIVIPAGDVMGNPLLVADADDAEVHLIVQTHGQARGGKKLREQLTYIETNCTPSCADVQFAVHLP